MTEPRSVEEWAKTIPVVHSNLPGCLCRGVDLCASHRHIANILAAYAEQVRKEEREAWHKDFVGLILHGDTDHQLWLLREADDFAAAIRAREP